VTVALLGAIFSYAARQGIQPDNPVHGFAEGWRQRRLTDDEYRQIGMALSGQPAIDATWLMIMTGMATWWGWACDGSDIDPTKIGASLRPLSELAGAAMWCSPVDPARHRSSAIARCG
jgi:hypothetical protein